MFVDGHSTGNRHISCSYHIAEFRVPPPHVAGHITYYSEYRLEFTVMRSSKAIVSMR